MSRNKSKFIDKTYRLADDRSGESLILKVGRNGRLLVFDPEQERERAIRHAPNAKTIFLDEQADNAYVETIIFEKGYLDVPGTRTITQQFLDMHPDNVANGGSWFELVDDEMEAAEEIELEEMSIAAKQAIREVAKTKNGVYQLEAVVAALSGSLVTARSMSLSELKRELYSRVDQNPARFCDESGEPNIFDDTEIKIRHLMLTALADGIIQTTPNGRSMVWAKSKEVITSAPVGVKIQDHFVDFLQEDEGILVFQEIEKLM